MIEKFIKVKDGLSYLLGNIDSAGRSRRSEIVGGCFLPAVKEARKVASKFKEPEVTFSYRDPNPIEKIGGQEFEDELQELILQTFLPGLDRSKFNYLFVRHHNPDKSYELNFYMVGMADGKQFSPYLAKRDLRAHKLLSEMLHQKYTSLKNPNGMEQMRFFVPNPRSNEFTKKTYEFANNCVRDILFSGIKSKNDIIHTLENRGINITNIGKNYITILHENRKVRLRGPAAEDGFDMDTFLSRKGSRCAYDSHNIDYTKLWREENKRREKILAKKYKNLTRKEIHPNERNTAGNEIRRTIASRSERNNQTECHVGDESGKAKRTEAFCGIGLESNGKKREGIDGSSEFLVAEMCSTAGKIGSVQLPAGGTGAVQFHENGGNQGDRVFEEFAKVLGELLRPGKSSLRILFIRIWEEINRAFVERNSREMSSLKPKEPPQKDNGMDFDR